MKKSAIFALAATMLAGAVTLAAAPASAAVSVGVGIGAPAYYPAYSYSCDPYSRWYDPYRCGYYAPYPYYGYGPYYYGPSLSFGFSGRFGGHDGFRGGFRGRR
jgi:hypothetical protein